MSDVKWSKDHWYFTNPKGMSADVNDTIYVADSFLRWIVKSYYSSGSISLIDYFRVPGILHPVDIAIDQCGTLSGNPSNDLIWKSLRQCKS